jgi:hypothetical protein
VEGFDAWVASVFSASEECSEECDIAWSTAPAEAAGRIERLFATSGALLGGYSDDQVARGLREIVDGGEIHVLTDRKVPIVLRTRGLRSIVTLFAEVFAPRLAVEHPKRPPLEGLCFMFFDIAPIDLGDDTVLDVLEAILALDSVACQRSALHGLGHAHFHAAEHVPPIVDRWLKKNRNAPQELREYAAAARIGGVM